MRTSTLLAIVAIVVVMLSWFGYKCAKSRSAYTVAEQSKQAAAYAEALR